MMGSDESTVGAEAFLELDNVEIVYDDQFLAVKGVSLQADRGDVIALLGPNGAGKSTILKMISGVGSTERAEVTRGRITYKNRNITNGKSRRLVNEGIMHILEGRRVFEDLTVEENLRCGLYVGGKRFQFSKDDYELAFEYFPQLESILNKKAGYASGGEQQMLVIARSLLYQPDLLLLDEPSLGLAPQLVVDIFERIEEINRNEDITVIVADQNTKEALDIADYGYVLEGGQVALHDPADVLKDREEIKEFYLGTAGDEERYSEIRHYKMRKRWS